MTEQDFYKQLGERIKVLRKKTDLNQVELAEKLGVNKSFIGMIESQGEKASAFRLNQLLEYMNYPSLLEIIDNLIAEKKTVKLTLRSAASPMTPFPA